MFVNSQPDYFGKRNKLEFAVTKVWEQTVEYGRYYGTMRDDTIYNAEDLEESTVYLSAGNDTINFNIKNKIVTVKNFDRDDLIELRGDKSLYLLENDSLGNTFIVNKINGSTIKIVNGHKIFDGQDKLNSDKGLVKYRHHP